MENTRNPYLLGFLRQHLSLLQFQVLINDIYAERFGPCQETEDAMLVEFCDNETFLVGEFLSYYMLVIILRGAFVGINKVVQFRILKENHQ